MFQDPDGELLGFGRRDGDRFSLRLQKTKGFFDPFIRFVFENAAFCIIFAIIFHGALLFAFRKTEQIAEGFRKRGTDKGIKLRFVLHGNAAFTQSICDGRGNAFSRIGERAVQVEEKEIK